MCKALSIGDQIGGASKDAVANMMCEHDQFAQGINLLVYSDKDDDRTAMTVFSFMDNKCIRFEITLYYNEDVKKTHDTREFINGLNYAYNEYNGIDLAVANYGPSNKLSRCLVWKRAPNYLQLTLEEGGDKNVMKFLVIYTTNKKNS